MVVVQRWDGPGEKCNPVDRYADLLSGLSWIKLGLSGATSSGEPVSTVSEALTVLQVGASKLLPP